MFHLHIQYNVNQLLLFLSLEPEELFYCRIQYHYHTIIVNRVMKLIHHHLHYHCHNCQYDQITINNISKVISLSQSLSFLLVTMMMMMIIIIIIIIIIIYIIIIRIKIYVIVLIILIIDIIVIFIILNKAI